MNLHVPQSRQTDLESELIQRARDLAPVLKARAAAATAARRVPRETIDAFEAAGFFRMVQPKRFGGYEVDYDVFSEVIHQLARGCASSAWVCSVLAEHNWLIGSFPLEVQEEVWGADDRARASSSLAPRPVEKVEGGFLLDGDWSFSSGCEHATWAALGGLVRNDSRPPGMYSLLVPMSDIEIVDDWHVLGLRATGSKTLRLKSVFVPERRALAQGEVMTGHTPGRELYPDSYLFRTPRILLATYTFTPVILALANRLLEEATAMISGRVTRGVRVADDPAVQMRVAAASAEIDFANTAMRNNCAAIVRQLKDGHVFSTEDMAANARDVAMIIYRLRDASEQLARASGSQWIYETSPLHTLLRDIWTASTHRVASYDTAMQSYGKIHLHRTAEG